MGKISPRRNKGPHISKPQSISHDHYLFSNTEKGSTPKQQQIYKLYIYNLTCISRYASSTNINIKYTKCQHPKHKWTRQMHNTLKFDLYATANDLNITSLIKQQKVLHRYLWDSTNYEHSTMAPTNYGHHISHGSQPIMGTKRKQWASTNYEHSKGKHQAPTNYGHSRLRVPTNYGYHATIFFFKERRHHVTIFLKEGRHHATMNVCIRHLIINSTK